MRSQGLVHCTTASQMAQNVILGHNESAMARPRLNAEIDSEPQGPLVIPAPLRRTLGFEPGDTLIAPLEEGRLDLALIPRTLDHAAFRFCS